MPILKNRKCCFSVFIVNFFSFYICTTFHRYPIFSTRYSIMCKVYTGYCGTSEIEHGLCACTVDNPLAKARGLSLRTGAQPMLYLPLIAIIYSIIIILTRAHKRMDEFSSGGKPMLMLKYPVQVPLNIKFILQFSDLQESHEMRLRSSNAHAVYLCRAVFVSGSLKTDKYRAQIRTRVS